MWFEEGLWSVVLVVVVVVVVVVLVRADRCGKEPLCCRLRRRGTLDSGLLLEFGLMLDLGLLLGLGLMLDLGLLLGLGLLMELGVVRLVVPPPSFSLKQPSEISLARSV